MALHLVTGYKGNAHITSADQGVFNAGCVGLNDCVLTTGRRFEAQVITSNTIRIFDGCLVMQGRHVNLDSGTFMDVTIANGTQSMNRNDLIVMRYTKTVTTGVESVELAVIQGGSTYSAAVDPTYTRGDILSGATSHEMPLYRVKMSGVNVASVEPLFNVVVSLADLQHGFYKQNMLINGDFQCNQRGQKIYDVTSTGTYTVDMWRAYQVKVQVLNEGITLSGKSASIQGYFTQFIQLGKLKTTTYTISTMADGEICTFTLTPGADAKEKVFDKFKISALTTSTWDDDLGDYNNKLKINICPIGTSSFTLTYVDVYEGDIVYPHVKEDYATAISRCKRYIQKSCYVSPILYIPSDAPTEYQFAICFDKMAHTGVTKPIVESCSYSYYTSGGASINGNTTKDTPTSLEGMFILRTKGGTAKGDTCTGIRGTYLVTCEPRDS